MSELYPRQFPFLFGGTFIEAHLTREGTAAGLWKFPFLFGGTFIEALHQNHREPSQRYFPSFSEGLSLRPASTGRVMNAAADFPSFSEGLSLRLVGGGVLAKHQLNFPSFSEGLSLRLTVRRRITAAARISLPFRRDFH